MDAIKEWLKDNDFYITSGYGESRGGFQKIYQQSKYYRLKVTINLDENWIQFRQITDCGSRVSSDCERITPSWKLDLDTFRSKYMKLLNYYINR